MAAFIVLLLGALGTGWWLSAQIEQRVFEETANLNAAQISTFLAPLLVDDNLTTLTPADVAELDNTFQSPLVDDRIVAMCLWRTDGRMLYSSNSALLGPSKASDGDMAAALTGRVTWEAESGQEAGASEAGMHALQQVERQELLGVYTPIRLSKNGPVSAVAEFYLAGGPLLSDVEGAQHQAWLIVAGVTLAIYLALVGFIQHTSDTVVRQQAELRAQVARLQDLLRQNSILRGRMRQATRRAVALHERSLRALGADLHDGPAQYLGLAFLHLDHIHARRVENPQERVDEHLEVVHNSLTEVMRELRAISKGVGLPQLETLSLADVVAQVVTAHEQMYRTHVTLQVTHPLPDQADVSIKTTLYRVIQEGLTNAYHHGRGIDERVAVSVSGEMLVAEISDGGPGFDVSSLVDTGEHMGLKWMSARVESLGGTVSIRSAVGKGTQIEVWLPLSDSLDSQ